MQLFSQQNFTIVRQIPDHTDPSTYYVRAVVRNARTDQLLTTLDLEDKGGLRFKKDWRVPPDPSGEGYYVSMVTSVYTDSGYTSKSPNYGDDENTYLVTDRKSNVGGGHSTSYGGPSLRDIRDIVKEELDSRKPKPFKIEKVKIPKQKEYEMKWDEVLEYLSSLKDIVGKIPSEHPSFEPIMNAMNTIEDKVDGIEIPKLDLTPVMGELEKQREQSKKNNEKLFKFITSEFKSLPKKIGKVFKEIMTELNFITSSVTYVGDNKPMMHQLHLGEKKIKPKPESGFDLTNLSK